MGTPQPIASFAGFQYYLEEIQGMEPISLNDY
jgi:hypothetical protein